jgi:hypothetical protein
MRVRDYLPRSRPIWILSIVLAFLITGPPFLVVGWLFCGSSIENWLHRQSFNAQRWKDQKVQSWNGMWPPRLCMVDDLLASGRLKGMAKSQVIELLGPADYTTIVALYYHLGPERGFFRIDSETLVVEFDARQVLTKSYIYRD